MGAAFNVSTAMEHHICGECGIPFSAPQRFFEDKRETGGTLHCPNGHRRTYAETELTRLRKQVAEKERALTFERNRREVAEREATASRKAEAKLKRRVGNGVCPCCQRSFQNLRRHMETKHPEVTGRAAKKLVTSQG